MTSGTHSSVASPAPHREAPSRRIAVSGRRLLLAAPAAAVLVMLLALMLGGGSPEPVAPGLPDPGLLTAWGLPLVRLVFDLCAVAVIGALVTALLLPEAGFAQWAPRALRATAWSAAAWSVSAAALLLLTISDVLGASPAAVFGSDGFTGYAWQLAQGRGLLLVVAAGIVLAAYSRWTSTRAGVALLLVVAVVGMLPVLFSGHSAAASDHDLATSSLVLHVVAASVWVGGLAGVLLLLRRDPQVLGKVVPRYSVLALVCFGAVAFSGLLNAWVRTSGDLGLWADSGYGALLAVKIAALVALGFFGWSHRRRSVGDVAAGRPRAFARLATVEVLVMAATIGVAVALSRTPPPAGATAEIPSHGTGHPTLGADVDPFTLSRIFTEWRPDAISLVLIVVAIAAYVAGVRRLRRDGIPWPWLRVAAAGAATAVALLATSGGLAVYSTAAFSIQVAQFLVLFIVVPTLVMLSAPASMVIEVSRPRGADVEYDPDWLPAPFRSRALLWVTDPLNTLIVVTVMVFALYATPLLEASLRSAPLHLTVNVFALAIGCLFWWSVLGLDPVPAPRPRSYRLWVLAGFAVLFAGIAARIYLSEVVLAGDWFSELDWTWVEMPLDQQAGARLMWVSALVLGPLLALLARPRPAVATQRETEDVPDGTA
jgi:cytochrome c oxidase assembly factor CtaG/putative copper export protein